MRALTRTLALPVALLALLGGVVLLSGRAGEPPAVGLEVVPLKGRKDAITAQRGKVVLIDLWGEF